MSIPISEAAVCGNLSAKGVQIVSRDGLSFECRKDGVTFFIPKAGTGGVYSSEVLSRIEIILATYSVDLHPLDPLLAN